MGFVIEAEPLSSAAFASFGDVFELPRSVGRIERVTRLENLRPDAKPELLFASVDMGCFPLTISEMERHPFSTQTLVPLDAIRYQVAVAGLSNDKGPVLESIRVFIASATQIVTFRPGIWHAPLAVLDKAATFAALMWNAGTPEDTVRADLPRPVHVSGVSGS